MRVGKYCQQLFFKKIALAVWYRRIKLEFGTVSGHRELKCVIRRLSGLRLSGRLESGVKLLHSGDEFFERFLARVRLITFRLRKSDLVERHPKRLKTRRLLINTPCRQSCRDIAYEIPMKVVGHARIA